MLGKTEEDHGQQSPNILQDHHLVAFGHDMPQRTIKDDETHADFDPRLGRCNLVIDDGDSHKIATMAGAGIALRSFRGVHVELSSGRLVRVLPDYMCMADIALWLTYRQTNVRSAKVRVFMDFLLDHIGRNPAWHEPVL